MSDEIMGATQRDKLGPTFSVRIPEATKRMVDTLSATQKAVLAEDVRRVIAHAIHEAKFDPRLYLTETDE